MVIDLVGDLLARLEEPPVTEEAWIILNPSERRVFYVTGRYWAVEFCSRGDGTVSYHWARRFRQTAENIAAVLLGRLTDTDRERINNSLETSS